MVEYNTGEYTGRRNIQLEIGALQVAINGAPKVIRENYATTSSIRGLRGCGLYRWKAIDPSVPTAQTATSEASYRKSCGVMFPEHFGGRIDGDL